MKIRLLILTLSIAFCFATALSGQGGRGGTPAAQGERGASPPANAKAAAPKDFTGQWMSVVTEDWRYRMIVPKKGDYAGVPLNPEGRKAADNWDPAKEEAAGQLCESYGAGGIMRMPGRIRIAWADDDTMKVETDAGMQTRMLYFKEPKSKDGDWQGVSQASWEMIGGTGGQGGEGFGGGPGGGAGGGVQQPQGRGGRGGPTMSGAIKVVTTKMKPGYLRRNGVPYSDKAVITEYFDRTDEPNGETWLVVKTIVEDPTYLNQPFIVSSHFKKQNDQSGWNPTPCSVK
jgi:hypothetical protein